MKLEMHFTSL